MKVLPFFCVVLYNLQVKLFVIYLDLLVFLIHTSHTMPVFIVILAVALLGGGYFFFMGDKTVAETAPVAVIAPAPTPVAAKQKYFDGQYSAEGSYEIPNKEIEKVTVSLTLKDGMITAVDFVANPTEQASVYNVGKFKETYKSEVVGKNIDEVALTVVNGASLSPKGFMDALSAIKVKAQTAPAV